MFNASELAMPYLRPLQAYAPGEQPTEENWVKLNTNENPYPPSPQVDAAIQKAIGLLRKYPSPTSAPLRTSLARHFKLGANQVFVGNGSDDVLNLLVRAFSGDNPVAAMQPSYSLYPVLTGIAGKQIVHIPFGDSMEVDIDAIANSDANLFFMTSPNAPTGLAIPNTILREILDRFSGIFVVDEAYADFADESAVELLNEYPNCVVTRTFSKSYSLAGLRVGFALADPSTVAVLDKVRDSYNVDGLAQAGAQAALEDQTYFKAITEKIIRNREYYRTKFDAWGWFTYKSSGNFLFTRPLIGDRFGAEIAKSLFDHLKANKILVRHFPKHPDTCAFLRISIGTEDEMESLIEAIESWLS